MRHILPAILAASALTAPARSAPVALPADTPAAQCEALNHLSLETAADSPGQIVSTAYVAGREATAEEQELFAYRGVTQGNPTPPLGSFPDHCRVEGYVTPNVKFMMMLPPPPQWNNRFMLAACEGWCGKVNPETLVPGLHRGYASITNDGGHYSREPFDGIWAHRNIEARINFAYRANHVTAQVGKAIAEAYYGTRPKFSYIAGFSKGGNAGLFTAQKYPEDFDGVFSMAPVVNYNPKNAAHFPWIAKAVYPDGKTPLLYSDKVPLIHGAVTKACDAIDGLRDGIIGDPRQCNFDPAVLLCKAGQAEEKNECLNAAQVDAVRKIYTKPTTADGTVYFDYRVDPGSEQEWPIAILPERGNPMQPFVLTGAATGLRYMATRENPGPGYDWMRFDYPARKAEIDEMSEILDPDSVDLSAFKARGGKIIIVHGWSDAFITAAMTIDWFEKMQAFMGGRAATDAFAQLYVVPGISHEGGGPAPHIFDALTPLVDWVENGKAPERLVLSDPADKEPRRARPAFPYPAYAKYKGKGDPNAAESFRRAE